MFPTVGIGLLVGVLVGMTVSAVVAALLGTLGSLLAVLLGLQDGGAADGAADGALARFRVNGLRIGAFGFACVAGLFAGVYVRAHDVFAVPVKAQVKAWTEAGFEEKEAQQLVVFHKLGITPEGKQIAAGDAQKAASSSLFGTFSDIDLCSKVSMQRLGNDAPEVLRAYRQLDQGNETDTRTPLYRALGALAQRVEQLPAESQRDVLQSIEGVLCEAQRLEK
jgi:hypothetical protein